MLQKRGAAFAGTDIATVKQDVGIVAEIIRPAGKLIGILRQAASIDGIAPEAQLAGTAVAEHVDGVNAAPLGRFPQRFGRDIQTIGPGCNHPDHGIARQGRHHRGIARQPLIDKDQHPGGTTTCLSRNLRRGHAACSGIGNIVFRRRLGLELIDGNRRRPVEQHPGF